MSHSNQLRHPLLKLFLVSLPSLLVCVLLIEIGLRVFATVSDPLPRGHYDDTIDLMLFEPGSEGTYVKNPDIMAQYTVNSAGWNAHREYTPEKAAGAVRVAVIGDSFIEAIEVGIEHAYTAHLERLLGAALERPVEVYAFGTSGAPLSQYLQIMRHVVATYAPDVVIINIVNNDFEESLVEYGLPYFLSYDIDAEGNVVEIPPEPYVPGKQVAVFRILAHSALVRYLSYNLDYLIKIKVMRMNEPVAASNGGDEARRERLSRIVTYSFEQYADLAARSGSRLLLVLDAPREDIYRGTAPEQADEYIYHVVSQEAAAALDIPLVDLTPFLMEDYAENHHAFDFENDYHWNGYAHRLIAGILFARLMALGWLAPGAGRAQG